MDQKLYKEYVDNGHFDYEHEISLQVYSLPKG